MILPHVGLVVLLVVYLLIGATVFHYLEAPNEVEVNCALLNSVFLYNIAFRMNKLRLK